MQLLIQEIYNLKSHREILEANLSTLKQQLADIDSRIEAKEVVLLSMLNEAKADEVEFENIVGFKQARKTVGYTSEADVISLLKSQYEGKYVKAKITESLDKNALKKALKSDEQLSSDLAPYMLNGTSEYVVVTTKENRDRMIEHINE